MMKRLAAATLATLFLAGPALAAPAIYTWTGYGENVPGSGKCPTYKMTIDVTVVGTDVQGRFQQEGRPERNFKATLGADKKFKTREECITKTVQDKSGSVNAQVCTGGINEGNLEECIKVLKTEGCGGLGIKRAEACKMDGICVKK